MSPIEACLLPGGMSGERNILQTESSDSRISLSSSLRLCALLFLRTASPLKTHGFAIIEQRKSMDDLRGIFQMVNAYSYKKTVTGS
jgi:hypothetical protein